jgi:hypothetical protein
MNPAHKKPNLFQYATKELSQDAFLCWLLAWSDERNCAVDCALHSAGLNLLNSMLKLHGATPLEKPSITIHKQLCHVDIVVEVNQDLVLMIEDKVDSAEHNAQLTYLGNIIREYPNRKVLPIFFKTGDQCDYGDVENAGYLCFLRPQLLSVLDEGQQLGVTHPIYTDFRDYLWEREASVEAFRQMRIVDWPKGSASWIGFFKVLKKAKPALEWGYVHNQSGGFWAAWWHGMEWNGQNVYLQIEEKQLCFKIETEVGANRSQMRDIWKEVLLEEVEASKTLRVLRPNRLGHGRWMTVAVSEQNEWMVAYPDGLLDIEGTLARLSLAESLVTASVIRSRQ